MTSEAVFQCLEADKNQEEMFDHLDKAHGPTLEVPSLFTTVKEMIRSPRTNEIDEKEKVRELLS